MEARYPDSVYDIIVERLLAVLAPGTAGREPTGSAHQRAIPSTAARPR